MQHQLCRHQRNIPLQHDSLDCGVFVLLYAVHLLVQAAMNFSQQQMPNMRKAVSSLLFAFSQGVIHFICM